MTIIIKLGYVPESVHSLYVYVTPSEMSISVDSSRRTCVYYFNRLENILDIESGKKFSFWTWEYSEYGEKNVES